jgi:hypothetical protein
MQAEDVLESRLTAIQNFLTSNDATIYAKLLYNLPQLYRAVMSPQLTMIIAPTDQRLQELSTAPKKPVATIVDSVAGRDLMANHISILPTQKVYPMFTAINGTTYGSGPEDLNALQIIVSTVIDGVVMLITPHLIGDFQQILKAEAVNDPGMTRDAFQALINTGDLRGKDLISLCKTNHYVEENFCNSKDATGRTIFHYLLKSEFGLDVPANKNARDRYVEQHRKLELNSRKVVGNLQNINGTYTMSLFKNYAKERFQTSDSHWPGGNNRSAEISPLIVRFSQIVDMLWDHLINLYLLVSVYAPITPGGAHRISLVRLIQDPAGEYTSSDSGERFSINVDPQRYNPVVKNGDIDPREIPVTQRVLHYAHPYPETLPFLYNKKIANYDLKLLVKILTDLAYTNSPPTSPHSLQGLFPVVTGQPKNIFNFMSGSMASKLQQRAIDRSLDRLAILIVENKPPKVPTDRFQSSYEMVQKSILIIILQMLLLFSGAVV